MKRVIPYILLLPSLSSCQVIQEEYYETRYAPPPPRVEIHRYERHHHNHRNNYRHEHTRNYQVNSNERVVTVNPSSQSNTHGHQSPPDTSMRPNVHGHTSDQNSIHTHANPYKHINLRPTVNESNTHGHETPSASVKTPSSSSKVIVHKNGEGN